jgi:hypothetical protein
MDYVRNILKKNDFGVFKKLVNNPVALTKFIYITEVLPQIEEYFLTDKADGLRAVLVLTDQIKKSITSDGELPVNLPRLPFNGVFDCELIGDTFYIFDVMEYNGQNISLRPFADRHKIIAEIDEILKKSNVSGIATKKYRKLSEKNYKTEIAAAFTEKRPYEIDGLIFTQCGTNYNKTQNLKWKPPEQLTVDFLYLNKMLWVGIAKKAWKQYGFPLPSNYARVIAPSVNGVMRGEFIIKDYFPVPFSCSLGDYSTKPVTFAGAKVPNLEGKIIEVSWDRKNDSWIFHRIRKDKEAEFKAGFGYGNSYMVAEKTLQSALNPLTLANLSLIHI